MTDNIAGMGPGPVREVLRSVVVMISLSSAAVLGLSQRPHVAIPLDAEFDAELRRARAIAAGHPADGEPYTQLRDPRKIDKERGDEPG